MWSRNIKRCQLLFICREGHLESIKNCFKQKLGIWVPLKICLFLPCLHQPTKSKIAQCSACSSTGVQICSSCYHNMGLSVALIGSIPLVLSEITESSLSKQQRHLLTQMTTRITCQTFFFHDPCVCYLDIVLTQIFLRLESFT